MTPLRILAVAVLIIAVLALWMPLTSEILCLIFRRKAGKAVDGLPETPRLLFLVPAHDEELLIADCVRSLMQLDYPVTHRRVLVIADNCTDATAALARESGADVLERVDAQRPGKPRALAWALDQVKLSEWDACIVVDADSIVAPQFAAGVAKLAPLNDIVFQPNNLVQNEFDNWLTRLGGLLGRSRFYVTYPLKQSAALNCPISNGMGFGTNLLIRDGWQSFSITEDTELYAVYTEAGVSIRHAAGADLFSQEARSLPQGAIQRRRWIAGRFEIARNWIPRLLRSPRVSWRQKLDAIVELILPAPVLHLLVIVSIGALALLVVGGRAGRWIAIAGAASLLGIVVTTLTAIALHPQPWKTVASFLMLPMYAVWRIVVLVRTVATVGDRSWRRTARVNPSVGGAMPVAGPRA